MGDDGIEGAAEALTTATAARAVEPEAGEAAPVGHAPGRECLNCATPLVGDYCHCCGQAGHVHRTLGAFWHDLLHGVLHFEGKIWRTLPLLAWRPGELTRRYVHGERARFVSPMALFLFAVFLMFVTFSTVGGPIGIGPTQVQLETSRAELRAEIARLEGRRAEAAAARQDTATIDKELQDRKGELAALNVIGGVPAGADSGSVPKEAAGLDTAGTNLSASLDDATVDSGGWVGATWKKARENPKLLLYKLQNNAYKFSWALIPLSVPFVWLLFLHRRRYRQYGPYDHIVFVTYSIAFTTLFVVALTLFRPLGLSGGWAMLALAMAPPLHMYRQLRDAYELSRWSAVWRTIVLLHFAVLAATMFFLLLLAIGLG
jgi:hypothetical protein